MHDASQTIKITIFDTTLRDGELALKRKLTVEQKIRLAMILDEMGVDAIEVGYPGACHKDRDEIFMVSQQVKHSTICGLASSQPDEIAAVASALKPAVRGRINVFTPIGIQSNITASEVLETIQSSVSLARNYCQDVEWSAFDATRCHPDLLCKAVETAIKSGATTIAIPDSLGVASPIEFSHLIETVMHRVPNIDSCTLAVHCHDDRFLAVDNSLAALDVGARQIECSINGLGVRAGNADLAKVVEAISNHSTYYTSIDCSWLKVASEMVSQFTAGSL
ncbi:MULTISPECIES: beta/alpha barrel domain-containing protein [Nostocales]|uniref:2-isopropylmalate synthase n=3 Tax=Nostocales TaxID=1161 RepID=A0A8S9T9F7_9CYAN|nr:2-isopropylmalate synthase [Tolypothrix bouteillei]KAF3888099.1 2-isopropylmalate synthase [Tolypothrix bouteillei VB521301]